MKPSRTGEKQASSTGSMRDLAANYRASLGVLVVLIGIAGFASFKLFQGESTPRAENRKSEIGQSGPVKYRATVAPKRFFDISEMPRWERSKLRNLHLYEFSSDGRAVIQAAGSDEQNPSFQLYQNDRLEDLPKPGRNMQYAFTHSGKLVIQGRSSYNRSDNRRRSSVTSPYWNPFGPEATPGIVYGVKFVEDDGSEVIIQPQRSPDGSRIVGFKLVRVKNGKTIGVLHDSKFALTLIESEPGGVYWIQEEAVDGGKKKINLYRISPTGTRFFEPPQKLGLITRMAASGKHIAATGFAVGVGETSRPYQWKENGDGTGKWQELPLPPGFYIGYVSAITKDGYVLGIVENPRAQTTQPVVWKDGALGDLSQLPEWPKNSNGTFILGYNRKGDIYVRNLIDWASNHSEYYLLRRKK